MIHGIGRSLTDVASELLAHRTNVSAKVLLSIVPWHDTNVFHQRKG